MPAPQVTEDGNGHKTVVFYRKDAKTGKIFKVTQKIAAVKVRERVDAGVAERKSWGKFGTPASKKDVKSTSLADEVPFHLDVKSVEKQQSKAQTKDVPVSAGTSLRCRHCRGDHFTAKCPLKDMMTSSSTAEPVDPSVSAAVGGAGKTGYLAPHLRNRAGGAAASPSLAGKFGAGDRDETTLRVTNLGEDVIEDDLRQIFGKFGQTTRVNILRDRETGKSRGFGFVVFADISQAKRAAEELDGKPLENLIMKVEFANKRE